jgi:hypothetical protein
MQLDVQYVTLETKHALERAYGAIQDAQAAIKANDLDEAYGKSFSKLSETLVCFRHAIELLGIEYGALMKSYAVLTIVK